MEEILKRIDEIINSFKARFITEDIYQENIFEIKQIIVSTVGKDSEEYEMFADIVGAKKDFVTTSKFLIGVLRGLKDHLVLNNNTEKRYQIFVSSTFKDLETYRKTISDEIIFRGYIAAGMEDFTACGEDLEKYIKRVIDQSDYYVLVIGQRWGSALPNDKNTSYTMMEYNYAKSKGMRIIPLIYNGSAILSGNDLDINGKKFEQFVTEISKTVPQYFKSENELLRKLTKALDNEIKNHPQKGWIRL